MGNGREQKLEFIKWCLGGGAVILAMVILLSFMQEFIKRKVRAWKAKKNKRPPICTSGSFFKEEEDSETVQASIRNSLVVKKYECNADLTEEATLRASESTFDTALFSTRTLESPRDIEENNHNNNTSNSNSTLPKEGSVTESSSEEADTPPPPQTPARRLSSVFRNSISNLSTSFSEPPPIKKTPSQEQVCKLCNMPFQKGDDICESTNSRCKHIFHQHCITSWLPYQNTCPICSEPFVILNM